MSRFGLLVAVSLAAFAGCDVPRVPTVIHDGGALDGDGGGADGDALFTLLPCDPADGDDACPDGLACENTARVCVECLWTRSRCTDAGDRETCPIPELLGIGEVEDGFYEPDPCPANEACVQAAGDATCEPILCVPGLEDCATPTLSRICNATGTNWIEKPCEASKACYEGACEPVRHNVLLLFDTSGSMHNYIHLEGSAANCTTQGTPCLEPFPVCDDLQDPLTLFALAKRVFAENIQAAIGGNVQFALQRFPQVEASGKVGNCWSGWYAASTLMTGDDGAHAVPQAGWFDDHRAEALLVPFPARSSLDNRDALLRWLDSKESVVTDGSLCTAGSPCDHGSCRVVDQQYLCYTHDEPELRAEGPTPLGKSLFYAGEYFRRSVLVDGKECDTSSDCGSVGYVCVDEICRDPYSHCRDNFIILFTDGVETEFPAADDFFNPVVQAKRLAYGLGCNVTDDCRGGAQCVSGTCWVNGMDPFLVPEWADAEGYNALARPDGSPVSIRTTVVTLEPSSTGGTVTQNDRIALSGGGLSLNVYAADPVALQSILYGEMTPPFKCQPEDL